MNFVTLRDAISKLIHFIININFIRGLNDIDSVKISFIKMNIMPEASKISWIKLPSGHTRIIAIVLSVEVILSIRNIEFSDYMDGPG